MAGPGDPIAEANQRWAKAARYAHGYADNGLGEALRVYCTRYFPAGVIVYAILVVVLGPLLFPGEATDWRFIAQIGVTAFGLFALIGGVIYNVKRLRPRVELSSNLAIVFPLTTEEQKYVQRVITGRDPAPEDPVRLQVARSVAVQNRKLGATNLLMAPLQSYVIGGALGQLSILWLLLAALVAGLTAFQVQEFHRQGRFLATTAPAPPAPDPETTS